MRKEYEKDAIRQHTVADSGWIAEALDDVKKSIDEAHAYDLAEQWQTLYDDYSLLLDYFGKGIADPERQQQVDRMRRRLHTLIDKACNARLEADPSLGQRKAKWRTLPNAQRQLADAIENYIAALTIGQAKSEDIDAIASLLQTTQLDKADLARLREGVVMNPSATEEHKAFCIGVLTDNICHVFSQDTAIFLVETMVDEAQPPAVTARTAVAIVASMITWPDRWLTDKALAFLLGEITAEHPKAMRLLRDTVVSFYKTQLTDTIANFMTNGLGNELGKIAAKIIENKGRRDKYEIRSDELREIFGNTPGVIDKFDRLAHWQHISADVPYMAYKMLKRGAFFDADVAWLKPFDKTDRHLLKATGENPPDAMAQVVQVIAEALNFCDSDKYSMMFSLTSIPSADIDGLKANIINETQSMTDMLISDNQGQGGIARLKANLFVQDVYRLCKLRTTSFGAPELFNNLPAFTKHGLLLALFPSTQDLESLGRSLVDMELWNDAAIIYARIAQGEGAADPVILRKYACCLFETNDYEKGYEVLKRAEIIDDDNIWTKAKIAEYLFNSSNFEAALAYYNAIEAKKQLTKTQLCNRVNCLVGLHRDAEAIDECNRLLVDEDCPEPIRLAKATCLAHIGRTKEAYDYATTIDLAPCDDTNFLLTFAALAIAAGDTDKALNILRKANATRPLLSSWLAREEKLLKLCGISRQDMTLASEYISMKK